MKLLINEEKVIVAIHEEITEVVNGYQVGDVVYAPHGLKVVDGGVVPEDVGVQTHKFVNGEYIKNENYVEWVSPEEEIIRLREQIKLQDGAILELAELVGGMLNG